MTAPDIVFQDQSGYPSSTVTEGEGPTGAEPVSGEEQQSKFPPPIIKVPQERLDTFLIWLDQWLDDLINDQSQLQTQWAKQEEAYRGKSDPPKTTPYIGACTDVVPAIAMAVDPIHARLDTGIFKQDPVFKVRFLKSSFHQYSKALEAWVDYYQRNKLRLRKTASPRLLELAKLGTCIFKTVYDYQAAKIKTYNDSWDVIDKIEVRFAGPRVFGISLGDFLFPASYQFLQDCPLVAERQRTTYMKLKVAEASGKLTNCQEVLGQETDDRTALEDAREEAASHTSSRRFHDEIEIYEVWCDYDIDGDGLPEHLVCTYHRDTRTLLQLRYNWYFHQRKPYTVIPYTVASDSLYGFGIAEMVMPLQEALTKWHQMATDNAYLSNIRMFIVKKESGIEEVPRLYAGRCFFVDDPTKDFIPFASGDIYPSTLAERQNIFGLIEKRTGVSDYLTGRESPIIGSRATATSTIALIQEGTKRVEEVLENIREGFSEIMENCLYIWIQFGADGLDDIVFGDDEIGTQLKDFFDSVSAENVNGALAIELSATDAAGSRQAMQQMQLQIIQIMMQYLEKLLQAGQGALQAQQVMPQYTEMIKDVMIAARNMFRDLLHKYDIRNPEDYLPDLEKYLNGAQSQQGTVPGTPGLVGGTPVPPGLPVGGRTLERAGVPRPATPGNAGAGPSGLPPAGMLGGLPPGVA